MKDVREERARVGSRCKCVLCSSAAAQRPQQKRCKRNVPFDGVQRNLRLLRTRATSRGREKWTPESGYFMVSNGYQVFYGHISLCFKLTQVLFLSFFQPFITGAFCCPPLYPKRRLSGYQMVSNGYHFP